MSSVNTYRLHSKQKTHNVCSVQSHKNIYTSYNNIIYLQHYQHTTRHGKHRKVQTRSHETSMTRHWQNATGLHIRKTR